MPVRDRVVWGTENPFSDPRLANLPWLVRELRAGRLPKFWRGNKVWENRWRDLPAKPHGYYREFYAGNSLESGGVRIVLGNRGECYISGNHHRDWRQIIGVPTWGQSNVADLIFTAQGAAGRSRVDGVLTVTATGRSWKACSGSRTLEPLPSGIYRCRNFRDRVDIAMVKQGIGFSIDLEPTFRTNRSLLRIHPDGNLPGTEGCIGITDDDVVGCYAALKRLLQETPEVRLNVSFN